MVDIFYLPWFFLRCFLHQQHYCFKIYFLKFRLLFREEKKELELPDLYKDAIWFCIFSNCIVSCLERKVIN